MLNRKIFSISAIIAGLLLVSFYFVKDLNFYIQQSILISKTVLGHCSKILYSKDLTYVNKIVLTYIHGSTYKGKSLNNVKFSDSTKFTVFSTSFKKCHLNTSFVYDNLRPNNDFRTALKLDTIFTGSKDEFDSIVKISTWIGSLWDHGKSKEINNPKLISPLELAAMGKSGNKLWCEVAGIMTVKTFSSFGVPARLVSLSRNGSLYDHGVADIWCNQFNKWIMIDADFNIIYKKNSIPLSSFEICHSYTTEDMARPDTILLGLHKKSLPYKDLIPFFNYVFIDLRNDWETRRLRRGSPAGGSLSTIWTVREKTRKLLWPGKLITDQNYFDWKINNIEMSIDTANHSGPALLFNFKTYSPYFDCFSVSLDDSDWINCDSVYYWKLQKGTHKIKAKVITKGLFNGPVDSCMFTVN